MRFSVFGASDDNYGTADIYTAISNTIVLNWTATESQRQIPLEAVVVAGFKVNLTSAPGVGATRTFTIRKNGVDTNATVTISELNVSGEFVGTLVFAAGDLISLKASSTGTPAAPSFTRWHTTMVTPGLNSSLLLGSNGQSPATSASLQHSNLFGSNAWTTNASVLYSPVPIPGNVTKIRAAITAAPGTAKSYAFSVRVNSTDALTATISDANTSAVATGSVAVAAGDLIQFKSVATGTPATVFVSWCVTYEATTNAQTFVGFSNGQNPSTLVTNYEQPLGAGANAWNTTTNPRRLNIPAQNIIGMYVKISVAPGVGSSRTIALGYDSTTTHSVLISGATATTGNDSAVATIPSDAGTSGLILSSAVPAVAPAACTVAIGYALSMRQPVASSHGHIY